MFIWMISAGFCVALPPQTSHVFSLANCSVVQNQQQPTLTQLNLFSIGNSFGARFILRSLTRGLPYLVFLWSFRAIDAASPHGL